MNLNTQSTGYCITLAPPPLSLPSLKMTARSYSLTTLTVKRRERGRVARQSSTENSAISSAMQPWYCHYLHNSELLYYRALWVARQSESEDAKTELEGGGGRVLVLRPRPLLVQ